MSSLCASRHRQNRVGCNAGFNFLNSTKIVSCLLFSSTVEAYLNGDLAVEKWKIKILNLENPLQSSCLVLKLFNQGNLFGSYLKFAPKFPKLIFSLSIVVVIIKMTVHFEYIYYKIHSKNTRNPSFRFRKAHLFICSYQFHGTELER